METGAIAGFFAGVLSPLALLPFGQLGLGFFTWVGVGTFISGALFGVSGFVHRLNGEVPEKYNPKKFLPTPAPRRYTSPAPIMRAPAGSTSSPGSITHGVNYYTVAAGDTLWGIAARVYGSGSLWQSIYQANRAVIGGNPNLIYPGERLAIRH